MASSTGYKRRRSPSVLDPTSSSPFVDDCHMLEARLSGPRERQGSEQYSTRLNGTTQSLLKRETLNHPQHGVRSETPAVFYDNLSKVRLTRGALRELDRRNAQPAPSSPCPSCRQPHRPFARDALVELGEYCRSTQSASDFLCHCTSACLKDIKRLAGQGGPDLLDLRGVRIPEYLLPSELTMSL